MTCVGDAAAMCRLLYVSLSLLICACSASDPDRAPVDRRPPFADPDPAVPTGPRVLQEGWWTVLEFPDPLHARVQYDVGFLWGNTEFPSPLDRPWTLPEVPLSWRQDACPDCRAAAQPSSGGVLDLDARLPAKRQRREIVALVLDAGVPWSIETSVTPHDDHLIVVHDALGHAAIRAVLRDLVCPH